MQNTTPLIDRIRALVVEIAGLSDQAPDDDDLLEVGFIASVEILTLIDKLEQTFDIEFGPFDILPENFSTLRDIATLVEEKMG